MAQERDYLDTASDDKDLTVSGTTADADDDGAAEAEQIKEQIAETRSQMGETIDAIQEKLSFANIQEQISEQVNSAVVNARDALLEATWGKAASIMKNISNELGKNQVSKTVMANPLPYLLLGAGAGLLIYQGYSGSGSKTKRRRALASAAHDRDSESGILDSARDTAGNVASGVVNGVSGVANSVSGAAGTVSDAAGSAIGKLTGAAGSAMSTVRDKAGDLGSVAREQYDTYIEDNPLAVGAVALALGAAVGFAIPSTNYEGQVLGPVRQNLIDQASEKASDLIDKGKDLVSEASKNISEAASSATAGAVGGSGAGKGSTGASGGSSSGSGTGTAGGGTGNSTAGTGTGSGGSGSGGRI